MNMKIPITSCTACRKPAWLAKLRKPLLRTRSHLRPDFSLGIVKDPPAAVADPKLELAEECRLWPVRCRRGPGMTGVVDTWSDLGDPDSFTGDKSQRGGVNLSAASCIICRG